jgi:hypothetical protein
MALLLHKASNHLLPLGVFLGVLGVLALTFDLGHSRSEPPIEDAVLDRLGQVVFGDVL